VDGENRQTLVYQDHVYDDYYEIKLHFLINSTFKISMMTTTLSDGTQSNKALFLDFDGVLHIAEKAANLARGLIPFDLVAYADQMDMFCWNSALEAALASDPSITVLVGHWRIALWGSPQRVLPATTGFCKWFNRPAWMTIGFWMICPTSFRLDAQS
jgi:hypothetical protein